MNKEEFKAALKKNGLKQTTFAAKTGYSTQGIAKWIKHDAVPVWVNDWFLGYQKKDLTMDTSDEAIKLHIHLLNVIERQLLEVVGILAIAGDMDDVRYGRQRLIGVIHGLRIVTDPHQPTEMSQCQTTPERSTS